MRTRIRARRRVRGRGGLRGAKSSRDGERGSCRTRESCAWHNWLMEESPFETPAGQACPAWHRLQRKLPMGVKEES